MKGDDKYLIYNKANLYLVFAQEGAEGASYIITSLKATTQINAVISICWDNPLQVCFLLFSPAGTFHDVTHSGNYFVQSKKLIQTKVQPQHTLFCNTLLYLYFLLFHLYCSDSFSNLMINIYRW